MHSAPVLRTPEKERAPDQVTELLLSKVVFLSLIINTGLVEVHLGHFWPSRTMGGGLGGPGGVVRGLKTLKITLSIGDHLRPWNAMF